MDSGRPTVLVVEDEEAIRRFLKASLEADSIRVILAGTAAQAQASTYRFRPDVTLLDLGLPDMDGVALIPRLREAADNSIIVLTASSQEASKVKALDAGADDYLTKPFGIQVLKARIRVALRHLSSPSDLQAGPVISLGDIDIDLVAREADWLPPWRDILTCCRRLEARGEIRGGRFVAGFSGEQYATPEAVGLLRNMRRKAPARQFVSLSAADPLNLIGILTPGSRLPSLGGNRLLYRDGLPIATLAAGEIHYLEDLPPEEQWEVQTALLRRQAPIALEESELPN